MNTILSAYQIVFSEGLILGHGNRSKVSLILQLYMYRARGRSISVYRLLIGCDTLISCCFVTVYHGNIHFLCMTLNNALLSVENDSTARTCIETNK